MAQSREHKPSPAAEAETEPVVATQAEGSREMVWVYVAGAVLLVIAFGWSYWPTLTSLAHTWNTIQDYSHGWLVVPLAVYAAWVRRDTFPRDQLHWAWGGLILMVLCLAVRYLGGRLYVTSVDGYSMLIWIAAAVWMLGGWSLLKWASPAIAFLIFMIPMPHKVEFALRDPLQRIATKFSCWILQCLGQPALPEGNTILLGEHHLEVEQACSGLRIFVAIAVLAFAYIIIVRPHWYERVLLVLSVVPIALISNAARIVITGMLYQFVSSEAAKKFSHDLAGWMMIPFAAAQFMLLLWYMGRLVKEVEVSDYQGSARAAAT